MRIKDKIFLDTSGLIALSLADQENHKGAVAVFKNSVDCNEELYTSSFVLEELATWLRCRRKIAVTDVFKIFHNLYISDLNVIEIGRNRFADAFILMHKFADHFFSMTDCMSFVVMKEFKINKAFTTDKHFQIAGFKKLL